MPAAVENRAFSCRPVPRRPPAALELPGAAEGALTSALAAPLLLLVLEFLGESRQLDSI